MIRFLRAAIFLGETFISGKCLLEGSSIRNEPITLCWAQKNTLKKLTELG